jgi:hypothetical protein
MLSGLMGSGSNFATMASATRGGGTNLFDFATIAGVFVIPVILIIPTFLFLADVGSHIWGK